MRRFLYYFPGRPGMNAALFREYGVLDRFEVSRGEYLTHQIAQLDHGPDGKSGCVVATGDIPPGYDPARQTWADAGGYWVGLEQPWPAPEDLIREMGIGGHQLQLSDGKVWKVPVLHRWDESKLCHVPNLPKTMRPRAGGGGVEYVVRPEYEAADALAEELAAGFFANRTVQADEAFDRAVKVLAVNYRIGPFEAGLLGVLNDADILKVLAIAIDAPTIEAQAMAMQVDGVEYHEPRIEPEE